MSEESVVDQVILVEVDKVAPVEEECAEKDVNVHEENARPATEIIQAADSGE